LDVLGERHPHYAAAARIWEEVEKGALKAAVSAISFNNIHYILRKLVGASKAREALIALNALFSIVPLDAAVITEAINTALSDFEDAIQYVSALRAGVDYFVTRDPRDIPKTPLGVISASELVAILESDGGGHPT
jgi:predicted nucleic acid-binding protein